MNCLTVETLRRYIRGNTESAEESDDVGRHLAECAACRELLRTEVAASAPRLVHSLLPDADHFDCLEEEALSRYAEGKADEEEREVAEVHLAQCARCREDVDSLKQFQAEMNDFDWSTVRSPTWLRVCRYGMA